MSSEKTTDADIRRGHIIRQLARPEMPKSRYKGEYWFFVLMYAPIGLGPILAIFVGWFSVVLLMLLTFSIALLIHTHLQDAKRNATKEKNYVESRTFVGRQEVFEQIEVLDIEPKAKPGKPYPFYKVQTKQENIHPLLSRLGESVRIKDADEINREIDEQIRKEVEETLKRERGASRARSAQRILVGIKKKIKK